MGIEWKPYFNPFCNQNGLIGRGDKLHFRLLPQKKSISLKIFDGYTGEYLKQLTYSEPETAQQTAIRIEHEMAVGMKLDDILERYAEEAIRDDYR